MRFLQFQALILDLPLQIHLSMSKKPVVVLTWVGTEPTLPAILLNNHMDKVPLFETNWSDNPFGGEIDDQKTYARTSPHKKTASIQCLEAVRRLKNSGVTLKRTINLCFAPGKTRFFSYVLNKDFCRWF